MGKFLLLVALILGAAFYFPQTRPVMLDLMGPVLNPVLTWQTKGEIDQINRELQTLYRTGQSLPARGEAFQEWMIRNFQGGSSLDAWGNSYSLNLWTDSVGVSSMGPDLVANTADDIVGTIPIRRQRRR